MAAKVLLVEDDRALREALSDTLLLGGHEFVAVDSAEAALPVLAREAFSLVISDVNMPGMDGLEAMRLILKHAPSTPILMTSGRPNTPNSISEPDYLTMATKLGAVSALPKPFKPAALLAMVSDCLERGGTNAAPSRPVPDAVPNA